MTNRINLCRIKGVGFPPPKNCHFEPSYIFFKKHFSKKFTKNALDIIRVLFKDESITINIVPQINFSLTFHGLSRLFAKTKVRKNYTQVGISLIVNL